MKSILVVDDIDIERMLIVDFIRKGLGLSCAEAESGNEALELLQKDTDEEIKVVLLDLFMPGMDGMEVMQRIKAIRPDVPVVILTGSQSVDHAVRAIQTGAVNFLVKPVDGDRLVTSVQNALDIGSMRAEIKALHKKFGQDGVQNDPMALSLLHSDGNVKTLEELEIEIAQKILDHSNGNISKAAKALGLARSTYYRKLNAAEEEEIEAL